MDIIEAIKTRKSIRGYKPNPVSREILKELLDTAARSPSAMNTQPWEIMVVGGEVLDKIKQGNVELLEAGAPLNPEVPVPKFDGVYRQRQVNLAKQLFGMMEIAKEDKEKRLEWTKKGLRFYDAPAVIILLTDDSVSREKMTAMDIGIICQTICLAAFSYELGTCIADQGLMYPETVRKFAGIPDSKQMAISICIGYPDLEFPANKLTSDRISTEEFAAWYGFD